MPEKQGTNWAKWGLIIGGVIFVIFALITIYVLFFVPSMVPDEQGGLSKPLELPEMFLRMGVILGTVLIAIIFVAGVVYIIWEMFFKKKELHIINEHHKIIKEATSLNPVEHMGKLILTGQGKIQNYSIGKIVGHTQVPVTFERMVILNANGKVDEKVSESEADYMERLAQAEEDGTDRYDFFAFVNRKGIYALPFFSMFESPKFFGCYPSERSPDLVGDVEIYDVGTWKISAVNIFVPANRSREPQRTIKEMEGQLFPIAYMGIIDYVGLVAQRGIEGDTSMQKWLQAKASTVNVKEREG